MEATRGDAAPRSKHVASLQTPSAPPSCGAKHIYWADLGWWTARKSRGDFGSFAATPLGLLVGGLLIASYGVEGTFLVAGLGAVFTALTLLLLPDFRRFGKDGALAGRARVPPRLTA